ncbi:MAG: molybdopterin cofactor-binding domain-containing protein [Sporichthyaceae bacterium]
MVDADSPVSDHRRVSKVVLGRRRFVTYLLGVPTLAVATRFNLDLLSPSHANAAVPSGTSIEEYFDIADAIILACQPTMHLVKLEVGTDGIARLDLPRIEMGQGITTSVAMVIAEELDLPMSKVKVTCADARPELLYNQLTAGSCTLRAFYDPIVAMAATARSRMVAAAARRWDVPAGELTVRDGTIEAPDGRRAGYGDLSLAAADPGLGDVEVVVKAAADRRIVGKPTRRVDGRDIVTGRKKFTMDLYVPGALPTMVRRAPTILGEFVELKNRKQLEAMSGVVAVATIPSGVAIVAETFEQARRAVNKVRAGFTPGPVPEENNESIAQKLRASLLPFAAPPVDAVTVESEFEWVSAAHASMETECAIADVRADRADIWGGFQTPIWAQQAVAELLGLPEDAVTAHVVPSGGGFGRRVFIEGALEAAQVSQQVGKPVKLMWSRTDDFRHGRVRPANIQKFRATLVGGQVVSFEQRVAGVSTDYRHGLGEIMSADLTAWPAEARQAFVNDGFGQGVFTTMVSSPYNFGAYDKRQYEIPLGMATSSYRSVPCHTARGSEEIVVDEIAEKLGIDPVEFRLQTLKHDRARAVLQKVADLGDWGRRMPKGFAQGVGYHSESRTLTAALIELDARNPRKPKVTKAIIAVDVGKPINPLGIEAQMQGCLAEAISLTLRAGLHIVDGLPLEGSYSQYHFARQADFPSDVQVLIMPDVGEEIGGTGEVGMAAPTGAIANAYYRATGRRPRRFPINHPVDFDPIPPGLQPPPKFEKR